VTVAGRGRHSFTRAEWSARARPSEPGLAAAAAEGGPIPVEEVLEVYAPLVQLLETLNDSALASARAVDGFLGGREGPPPFIIGLTGGVAVGKTAVARVLRGLLARGRGRPGVEVLGTDAFLFSNRVLEARGLAARKGFPETYDQAALLDTLASVRAGEEVSVPVYSHQAYDVLPERRTISRPDVVIVEGLTVLQTGPTEAGDPSVVSDFLDVALYVDAAEEDAQAWFTERLLALRAAAGPESATILRWLSSLPEAEARDVAATTWSEVNLVNLRHNVAPTRARAQVLIHQDTAHRVDRVEVRMP
jgi:type I pantothenate kinase